MLNILVLNMSVTIFLIDIEALLLP